MYTAEPNGYFVLHTVGFYLPLPSPLLNKFPALPHKQAKEEWCVHQITESSKMEGSFESMLFIL